MRQTSPHFNCIYLVCRPLVYDGLSSLKEMMSPRERVENDTPYSPHISSCTVRTCLQTFTQDNSALAQVASCKVDVIRHLTVVRLVSLPNTSNTFGVCLDLVFLSVFDFLCVGGGARLACNLQTHRLMSAVCVSPELNCEQSTHIRPWVRSAKKMFLTGVARMIRLASKASGVHY